MKQNEYIDCPVLPDKFMFTPFKLSDETYFLMAKECVLNFERRTKEDYGGRWHKDARHLISHIQKSTKEIKDAFINQDRWSIYGTISWLKDPTIYGLPQRARYPQRHDAHVDLILGANRPKLGVKRVYSDGSEDSLCV